MKHGDELNVLGIERGAASVEHEERRVLEPLKYEDLDVGLEVEQGIGLVTHTSLAVGTHLPNETDESCPWQNIAVRLLLVRIDAGKYLSLLFAREDLAWLQRPLLTSW